VLSLTHFSLNTDLSVFCIVVNRLEPRTGWSQEPHWLALILLQPVCLRHYTFLNKRQRWP